MTITSVVQLSNQRRQFQDVFANVIEYEAIYDPPSVNSNSFASETIAVPGARFGDFVLVNIDIDQAELVISAHVHSANVVDIHLSNNTAGAVDLDSCNLHILVLRPLHRN